MWEEMLPNIGLALQQMANDNGGATRGQCSTVKHCILKFSTQFGIELQRQNSTVLTCTTRQQKQGPPKLSPHR